jgi:hypothetical protein
MNFSIRAASHRVIQEQQVTATVCSFIKEK